MIEGMINGVKGKLYYRGYSIEELVEHCSYPLTAPGCVSTVVTDLAVIDIDPEGFLLRELAPGVSVEEVRQVTAAPLRVADDVREMEF